MIQAKEEIRNHSSLTKIARIGSVDAYVVPPCADAALNKQQSTLSQPFTIQPGAGPLNRMGHAHFCLREVSINACIALESRSIFQRLSCATI